MAPAIHKEVHTSLRPLLTGQHELRAAQLAASATKHVAMLLGAVSVYQLPSAPSAASAAADGPTTAAATADASADACGKGGSAQAPAGGSCAEAGVGQGAGEGSAGCAQPSRGASHVLLFHALCTPMDDMVLADSTLCTMVRTSAG